MDAEKKRSKDWKNHIVKQDEIDCYVDNGKDFIDEDAIEAEIVANREASSERIRSILKKAHEINLMSSEDVAALVNVTDPALRKEVYNAACEIKKQVYDNRLVTFAPLYCGSKCVNLCKYCGFCCDNRDVERRVLNMAEIKKEAEVLAGKIGHKRLVMVYGEHSETDAQYIADSMKAVYSVKVPTKHGVGQIRRVNINAPLTAKTTPPNTTIFPPSLPLATRSTPNAPYSSASGQPTLFRNSPSKGIPWMMSALKAAVPS